MRKTFRINDEHNAFEHAIRTTDYSDKLATVKPGYNGNVRDPGFCSVIVRSPFSLLQAKC